MLREFFSRLFGHLRGEGAVSDVSLLFDQFGERLSMPAQQAVVTLSASVAVADGFLGREEFRQLLESMSHELGMSHETAGFMLDGILGDSAEGLSVERAAALLRRSLEPSQLRAVVEILWEIARAEDGIQSEEQTVISHIERLLLGAS